ncbi:hypothetical protein HYPDE_26668 [Hyphomicrobium denitrificans 1NES1]|uniref:Uncharacterized protein n=1 Tax=Hyphomicrobium denitrificans 1NES1 TaxID=670307 RepID=N0B0R0_9HYPH|nr:hypothetical protein [Hyphomicrobium denitrificans]AGK57014.1 hypothetical protein HYPDE_26668 [Hyphomicrobium denitrificans 1NES1]
MSDAAKFVKNMFAPSKLGKAPNPEEALRNLHVPATQAPAEPSEPMVQVNVRVPASKKKRLRLLAARDGKGLADVILEGLELYEERHGRAPNV